MKNFPLLAAASIALFGCWATTPGHAAEDSSLPSQESAVVLRVKAEDVTMTKFSPSVDCPEGRQCIQFNRWVKYKATVLQVVAGHWSGSEVDFANLQHGQYANQKTLEIAVALVPASPSVVKALHVNWVARRFAFASSEEGKNILRADESLPP